MDLETTAIILPMTAADLEEVIAIESDSFPRPWTRDHFLAEIDSNRSLPLVAKNREGRIAGYICSTHVLDEGEILDVAVRRDCRGKGLGRMLVTTAISTLTARGVSSIGLEVRASNASAIALYRRIGFETVGLRKNYYENGEDAFLMAYTINDSEDRADAV
ncbi:ribosomal protein S18-alanine N-acetyltransferase [Geobacter sp.]|uniref:ribosomal protein S18-alanine N-acetyltransferase n=1 Tax=Geobacter sp. TaxID=46610 RepID=UPI00261D65AB|nr:ribosomal protein S18-alanine N-acetyltransferase [Geobacter sp.]